MANAKSKKQIKRKHEFRYHNIVIVRKDKKIHIKPHPTYVFLETENIYIYVTITHSNKVRGNIVIKLRKNPNPIDGRDSYRVIGIKQDSKETFGKKKETWEMDEQDDQDIRDEYSQIIKKIDDSANRFPDKSTPEDQAPTNHLPLLKQNRSSSSRTERKTYEL